MRLNRNHITARDAGKAVMNLGLGLSLAFSLASCSTVQSVFAVDPQAEESPPIENPFADPNHAEKSDLPSDYASNGLILRSRRGDRSVEVEIPDSNRELSELAIPVSPLIPAENADDFASDRWHEERDSDRKPSAADREITASLPEAPTDVTATRQSIEEQLHLIPSQEKPRQDRSYLAALDKIKTLYRRGRFEAALLETDDLLQEYPTDARVYEMRGTLFERIRKPDLALKNWKQALRLDPGNESLRRFIDKKEQTNRGIASP